MCGIVGGAGKIDFRKYLLEGLKKLDYRGYDSAGLAYFLDGNINLYRVAGRVEALAQIVPPFADATAGIAHTRWATHGEPSKENAHPQYSMNKEFYVVHNGVIENFRALKAQLIARKYVFNSQTDTEVIANSLERFYKSGGSVLDAIHSCIMSLQGSYACAILHKGEPDKVYFMKNCSPLLLGAGEGACYLASDPLPMISLTDRFVDLDDLDYGYVSAMGVRIFHDFEEKKPVYVKRSLEHYSTDLGSYPHYMLKEIEEEPHVLKRLIDNYYDGKKFLFSKEMIKTIQKADNVVFIACGTSYYACKLGVRYFHFLGKRSSALIASEWAYDPFIVAKNPVFILLTQSGETADLIRCQKIINERGLPNIAVTNTKGSTIDRNATYSCLLYAGLEVAVASTKSYIAQVSFLALLTGCLDKKFNVIEHLGVLTEAIRDIIARKKEIETIAEGCYQSTDAFYVGRNYDFCACLEGALKLKEVAYIHAEAYPGGELKHGPIALIENGTLVVGLISEPSTAASMRNNLEELAARKAKIVVFSTQGVSKAGDDFIIKDLKPYLAPIAEVVVAQYLSYYVALKRGCPIDKPRNLAKSVTVE